MKIAEHITNSLKLEKTPSPWPRMILCTLSVSLPLVAGYVFKEQQSSIYGALLGFILILNDHFGPLQKRILHLLASFCCLSLAFLTGMLVSQIPWMLIPILFLMAFILGKSKGQGIELERLLLFSIFQLLNAALTPKLGEHALKLFLYASLSLTNYLVCLSLVYVVMKHQPNFQRSKREELLALFSRKDSHRYAFTLAGVSCLGLAISNYFHVERAQWMVGTILIVMMPNTTQSFQKSFQRIFGTFIGVFCSVFLTHFMKSPLLLISFSAVAAFLAPLGLIKNYWLGNAFIAALIMFFLQFGNLTSTHSDLDFAILRVIDIGLGCIIGSIGTLIAFPDSLARFFRK
jgi:uncharacterized membrane protein YccC